MLYVSQRQETRRVRRVIRRASISFSILRPSPVISVAVVTIILLPASTQLRLEGLRTQPIAHCYSPPLREKGGERPAAHLILRGACRLLLKYACDPLLHLPQTPSPSSSPSFTHLLPTLPLYPLTQQELSVTSLTRRRAAFANNAGAPDSGTHVCHGQSTCTNHKTADETLYSRRTPHHTSGNLSSALPLRSSYYQTTSGDHHGRGRAPRHALRRDRRAHNRLSVGHAVSRPLTLGSMKALMRF
jgi:hypothetical protein